MSVTSAMMKRLLRVPALLRVFVNDEKGAVTIDYVVLTAIVATLGMAVLTHIKAGGIKLSGNIAASLEAPNQSHYASDGGNNDISGNNDSDSGFGTSGGSNSGSSDGYGNSNSGNSNSSGNRGSNSNSGSSDGYGDNNSGSTNSASSNSASSNSGSNSNSSSFGGSGGNSSIDRDDDDDCGNNGDLGNGDNNPGCDYADGGNSNDGKKPKKTKDGSDYYTMSPVDLKPAKN